MLGDTNWYIKSYRQWKLCFLCAWPFLPLDQCAYSPYCSLYISLGAYKEILFHNQVFLQLVIISFIPLTLMCDSEVIL